MTQTRRDFLRQTGCAALGTTVLATGIKDFGLVNAFAQTSAAAAADYKALVCVFMTGGNDGNNTVVPVDQTRYQQYVAARAAAGLALPAPGQSGGLLPINPASGGQYGLHPSMTEMQALFTQGKAAVLCNAGPLVEPLTKSTYQNGTGKKPVQLFSHSDQVGQWMSSVSNDNSQTGWGGRAADRAAQLNGTATFPQMVSIAGVNLFVTGQNTRPLAIGDSNTSLANVLPLDSTSPDVDNLSYSAAQQTARRTAFDAIRALVSPADKLSKAAADTTTSALQTSAALGSVNPSITTTFPNTSLARQLLQVARLIALRDTLSMKRQIFFVSIGGFDTHNNQTAANSQSSLLQQVSQAINAFYNATVELGVADKVTTFTLSDFGRTFQPAGSGAAVGSDHAWGNHHFVVGGAVRGGDFYGTYPTLVLGGPDDTDSGSNPRGRWIPTTSVEQYAATLALWYGLSQSDLPLVFPFVGRFNSANLGFMS